MRARHEAPTDPLDTVQTGIRQWLDSFAAAVRDADYQRGRELFDGGVLAFGTRTVSMDGLDSLVAEQWQPIWETTRGFRFFLDQLQYGGDGDLAWAAVPWHSQGRRENGDGFDRFGRATYVLRRRPRDGRWVAVHSHHSLNP